MRDLYLTKTTEQPTKLYLLQNDGSFNTNIMVGLIGFQ